MSKRRTVVYSFEYIAFGPAPLDCERVLSAAKAADVVVNYDDGRDANPWFEAAPGDRARALRDEFLAAGYSPTKRSAS